MTEKNTDEGQKALTVSNPAPTAPADDDTKVRLSVADPWVHSFTVPKSEAGGTLEVTKQPKEFSAKDAERIRKAAERHGTTIKETK